MPNDIEWLPIATAPEGRVVRTKVCDSEGSYQKLIKHGRLWWFPDMSIYIYYTPTHWAEVEAEMTKK